jgi:hypothetical protein
MSDNEKQTPEAKPSELAKPAGSLNPFSQPCKTCQHYGQYKDGRTGGMCASIPDEVLPYWTGCGRWIPKENV